MSKGYLLGLVLTVAVSVYAQMVTDNFLEGWCVVIVAGVAGALCIQWPPYGDDR